MNYKILAFLFCLPCFIHAQTLNWAHEFGNPAYTFDEYLYDIETDNVGSVYSVGTFRRIIDFDGGPGSANFNAGRGTRSIVLKYDQAGNYVWGFPLGAAGSSPWTVVTEIEVDDNGDVYVLGRFDEALDADPGSGVLSLTPFPGTDDCFVGKYDSNGNLIWAASFLTDHFSLAESLTFDKYGNLLVGISFSGTIDADPGPGVVNHQHTAPSNLPRTRWDCLVVKLAPNGTYLNSFSFGGNQADRVMDLAVDNNNNIYVSGAYQDTVDFDPGVGVFTSVSLGGWDGFLVKYDSVGNFQWMRPQGGTSGESTEKVCLDSLGNAYITGAIPGGFLHAYDPSGNLSWSLLPTGGSAYGFALDIDQNGILYLAGYFSGSPDIDPGVGVHTLTAYSNSFDIFAGTFTSSGTLLNALSIEGSSVHYANSIAAGPTPDCFYLAGYFRDSMDAHPGTGVQWMSNITNNDYNAFQGSFCFSDPVSLDTETLLLEASSEQDGVSLTWHSAQSPNSFSHEGVKILRSSDGIHFTQLNTSAHSTKYFDSNPHSGLNYYQAEGILASGELIRSNVILLQWETFSRGLVITPNPAKDRTQVNLIGYGDKKFQMKVRDVMGKTVWVGNLEGEIGMDLQVGNWPSGLYFLEVADEVKRLIVE